MGCIALQQVGSSRDPSQVVGLRWCGLLADQLTLVAWWEALGFLGGRFVGMDWDMDGRGWQGGAGFFGGVDGWGGCLWLSICWFVCSCFDRASVLLWGGRNRIGIPETGVTSTRSSIWFTCPSSTSAKIRVPLLGQRCLGLLPSRRRIKAFFVHLCRQCSMYNIR